MIDKILEELKQVSTPDQHLNNAIDLLFKMKFEQELEQKKYVDTDIEIKKGLIDRIKRQEKEIEELKAQLELYENGVYFSSQVDELQARIDKAIDYITNNAIFDINGKGVNKTLFSIVTGSDKE